MGLVMQVLEETVTDLGGDELWGQVTEDAGVSAVFSRFDRYPGSDFLAIVEAVANKLSVTIDDAMVIGGEKAFPHLYERWPSESRHYDDAVSLIADLDEVIHAEVRRWAPDSEPPRFEIRPDADEYIIRYSSSRSLSHFCRGLLQGAFRHFDTPREVEIDFTDGTTTQFRSRRTS